jgi:hypothetical protein
MIQLRPYQTSAIEAILAYWQTGGGNPLVDLATGTGKSLVIAKLTQDLLALSDPARLDAGPRPRELVEQNFQALLKVWPDAPIGLYSAGLGKRDSHHRITFASIQSVYRKARELGRRDLILIDEAHLVPTAGNGMYRTLLEGPARSRRRSARCRLHRHALPARHWPARRRLRPAVRPDSLFLWHRRGHPRRLPVAADQQGQRIPRWTCRTSLGAAASSWPAHWRRQPTRSPRRPSPRSSASARRASLGCLCLRRAQCREGARRNTPARHLMRDGSAARRRTASATASFASSAPARSGPHQCTGADDRL